MTAWILLVSIYVNHAPMPWLAFDTHVKCDEYRSKLPPDVESDCILFGADVPK